MKVTICAKSRWHPAVRREHALSLALVHAGHEVDFVERARDIRDLRGRSEAPAAPQVDRLRVRSPFTPVPGHHDALAYGVETLTLATALRRLMRSGSPDVIVVNAPWNWQAVTRVAPRGVRRVLDLGDDWATLLPRRRTQIEAMYRRISDEADAIVAVTPGLQSLFDRPVSVVPNAVAPEVLSTDPTSAPGARRMVYVGTLSERFDSELMLRVLQLLPDWTLDLYGPCHYAGLEGRPSAELTRLLEATGGRVSWHGLVERRHLSEALDAGDVLVLPNEPSRSDGQDPMKLYDYAARARPIVATRFRVPESLPPGFVQTDDPESFAAAVAAGSRDVSGNRTWAEANSWPARLPHWLDAVQGNKA